MDYTWVDTVEQVADLLNKIAHLPNDPPSLYVDLEGINLCRVGTISILQVYSVPQNHTFLVDIHILGEHAFTAKSSQGDTLKSVLESEDIPKVFWDVRNDSDALYAHFQIELKGIIDLQLISLAEDLRDGHVYDYSGLPSLISTIRWHCASETLNESAIAEIKAYGKDLFNNYPERVNERPIPPRFLEYCIHDVALLPKLYEKLTASPDSAWAREEEIRDLITNATLERVQASQHPDFRHSGNTSRCRLREYKCRTPFQRKGAITSTNPYALESCDTEILGPKKTEFVYSLVSHDYCTKDREDPGRDPLYHCDCEECTSDKPWVDIDRKRPRWETVTKKKKKKDRSQSTEDGWFSHSNDDEWNTNADGW